MTTRDPQEGTFNLGQGHHAIPYTLYVPEKELPTFTYVDVVSGTTIIAR